MSGSRGFFFLQGAQKGVDLGKGAWNRNRRHPCTIEFLYVQWLSALECPGALPASWFRRDCFPHLHPLLFSFVIDHTDPPPSSPWHTTSTQYVHTLFSSSSAVAHHPHSSHSAHSTFPGSGSASGSSAPRHGAQHPHPESSERWPGTLSKATLPLVCSDTITSVPCSDPRSLVSDMVHPLSHPPESSENRTT